MTTAITLPAVDEAAREILRDTIEMLDLRAGDRFLIASAYAAILVRAGFCVRCLSSSRLAAVMQADSDLRLLELTSVGVDAVS